jgi:hypothetical protein
MGEVKNPWIAVPEQLRHELQAAHGPMAFPAGDRIRFTGTDKRVGIFTGGTGTIEAINIRRAEHGARTSVPVRRLN